ncbi:hypothetical protein CsSME_00032330 [Camellia sinensis var. sinensis]
MQSYKPIDTPVAKGESLSLDMGLKTLEEEKMARVPYSNAAHWKVVKRILRNLRGIADYTLRYQSSDLCLVGYCDADC